MSWFSLMLCVLVFFPCLSPFKHSLSSSLSSPFPLLCHPHESSALLHFNHSVSILDDSFKFSYCASMLGITNPWRTTSWEMSKDCCTWSGVTCDEVIGHVIGLDLKCSGLRGILHSNSSLFSLTRLQTLILSDNNFYGSKISSQFGRFVNMTYLDLSNSQFTGQVPLEISYLSNLVTLDLSRNYELRINTSNMKRIVANLTNLREFFMGDVDMSFISPNSFVNLSTSLTSLDLSSSALKGEFPENIFQLPNLQDLDLSYNLNITGSFPHYNWSSQLRNLNLSGTGFLIDLPYLTRNLKYLSALSLGECRFVGSYPTLMLGNFTQITSLDLFWNNFVGEIPWSSFLNSQLTYLSLGGNNLIGDFPKLCGNSTKISFLCDSSTQQLVGPLPLNLKMFDLYDNLLNGTIPSWLYSLPSLQYLVLSNNQFTGHINQFQYNSLVYLLLGSNKLQGSIPRSIFLQVNLSYLDLSSNNLSGVVWSNQISKLKKLAGIDLSFNSLPLSSINNILYTLPDTLSRLSLSSCGISEFPYAIRSLGNLGYLDLSNNRIGGNVPHWLWNVGKHSLYFLNISRNSLTHMGQIPWKNIEYIDLHSNRLQGHLPLPPLSTQFLSFSNNQLDGEISSLFCNLSSIDVLDLSYNNLSGNIPPCIGNSSFYLSVLDLRMNNFQGTLPPAFAARSYLRTLNLNGNKLEGPLPRSLVNCEMLEVLDIGNNKINGSFPWWLESLPELQVLILRSNRFVGPIRNPMVRFPFKKLRIIDLSNNEFMGLLPTKYFENFVGMIGAHTNHLEYMVKSTGQNYYEDSVVVAIKGHDIELVKIQRMFIAIDFSRNKFTEGIPKLIGKLNSLKGLNLSHNKLSGSIPPSLGDLSNLEWLDLSSNELIGKIPWQLATYLNQLGFLSLANNKLEGPIPRGPQFDTFKDDSYNGNVGLCGFQLTKPCNEDTALQPLSPTSQQEGDEEEHANGFDWKVVVMGYASGMVIGISLGYIMLTDKTIDWLLNILRLVKRSNRNAHPNGGIRRRN